MKRVKSFSAILLISVMVPAALLPLSAQDLPTGEITADELYDLIAGELTSVLSSNHRFEPLPPALSDLSISPGHLPCFTFPHQRITDLLMHMTTEQSYTLQHDRFRLLVDRRVVGWGMDGTIAVTRRGGNWCAVIGEGAEQPLDLPNELFVQQAYQVGSWIFQTSQGFFEEGNHLPIFESDPSPSRFLVIADGASAALIRPNRIERREGVDSLPLVVCTGKPGNWDRRTFGDLPFDGVTGVLRGEEGKLLVVGDKIAFLHDNLQRTPPEEKLLAALTAAKSSDVAALGGLLEELTLYPSDALRRLSDLFAAMPRGTHEEMANFFEGTLQVIDRMERELASSDEQAPDPDLHPLLERYARETRKVYDELIAASGSKPERFPHLLARYLNTGYQYYRGWWIRRPRVLLQTRLSDAVIELTYKKSIITPEGRGIFRVEGSGELHLLLGMDDLDASNLAVSAVEDPDGRALLLLRNHGLLRIDGDQANWLDRSEAMKKMGSLIGCDAGGRIYFRQTGYYGRAPRQYMWVYHPEGKQEDLRPAKTYPLIKIQSHRTAAMDESGKVWFIAPPLDQVRGSSRGHGSSLRPGSSLPDESYKRLARAKKMILDLSGLTASPDMPEAHRRRVQPGLYCLDREEVLHRCFVHEALGTCTLSPGRSGSMVLAGTNAAFLIHEGRFYQGTSLHDLATMHFSVLFDAAPAQSVAHPRSVEGIFERPLSWFRAGDILWIADAGTVEAYRKGVAQGKPMGEPFGLQQQIVRLAGEAKSPFLLGPLGPGDPKNVVIVLDAGNLAGHLWAGNEGTRIALSPFRLPAPEQPTERGPIRLPNPGRVVGSPAVDCERGVLYYHNGYDRIWKITGPEAFTLVPDGGRPILLLPDGRILVNRTQRTVPGYRFITGSTAEDLGLPCLKPLLPVGIDRSGAIFCLTPSGISWIRPSTEGGYALSDALKGAFPGVPVQHIGHTDKRVYLRSNHHLLVSMPR